MILRAVILFASTFGFVRAAEPNDLFESRIRPILVERCYACHNSAKTAKGGFALDDRASLLKGGDGGAVIVPGKPEASRLLPILRHEVEGLAMPKDGPKLDAKVIADFERWIKLGAKDPRDAPPSAVELAQATSWEATLTARKKWWSFQPVKNPPLPAGSEPHPVDRFIVDKLLTNKLALNPPAEPHLLVRRLYFALVGLPPSVAELDAALKKLNEKDGYEALVDELLARPQFGERWARHWMDWVRYADTHGSEGDPEIAGAWRYRDYLIRALNADVPYDQLLREHAAGDLFAKPRIANGVNESKIGPAHFRMVYHGFAPTDALDEKARFLDDEISTFTKAFLGLTVACARCHDHKFDAISQKDYSALYGVLSSSRPGRGAIETAEVLDRNRAELEALKPRIRAAVADSWLHAATGLHKTLLDDGDLRGKHDLFAPWRALGNDNVAAGWRQQQSRWNESVKARELTAAKRWNLATADEYAKWFREGNGLPGRPAKAGEFSVSLQGDRAIAGIYPAGLYTQSVSSKHAARLESPYFKLDDKYDLYLRVIGDGSPGVRYVVQDYPRDGVVFHAARLGTAWAWQKFDLAYWTGDEAHLELATAMDGPVVVKNEPRSWFGIREALLIRKGEKGPAEWHEELDPLFDETKDAPPASLEEVAEVYVRTIVIAVKAWQTGSLTDGQALLLSQCLEAGLLPNKLGDLRIAKPLIEQYRKLEDEIPVPSRVPALKEETLRNAPQFERGDHKKPGAEVPRRFLEAIDATPYKNGRLDLAASLVSDANPLPRRVIVNRLWHHLFGRGLVATPDNFGKLGSEPSHPELLDYLAARFKEKNWSLKESIRFLVTSKTWKQGSKPTAAALALDPENRLLSHVSVRRLEAEAIRDSLLAVSGMLNRELYGPPVDGTSDRRGVYVAVKRNAPDPFLRAFDAPEPFSAVGRRDVTNVPAQALTLMNDPRVATLAANWAERLFKEKSDDARIQRMMLEAFARPATAADLKSFKEYAAESKDPWRDAAKAAFSMKEFVYVR